MEGSNNAWHWYQKFQGYIQEIIHTITKSQGNI